MGVGREGGEGEGEGGEGRARAEGGERRKSRMGLGRERGSLVDQRGAGEGGGKFRVG